MAREDITLNAADRGILVGASGTGKSSLANFLIDNFRKDYPTSRILVLDTKPRWRAELKVDGSDTRRLYRKMVPGDTIPRSVAMPRMQDWSLAWDPNCNPEQTVIAQNLTLPEAENVRFQVLAAERFFSTQDAKRPSLIYIDEGMDFFTATSGARGSSQIVQRCMRAGRERNLATLLGVQRPKGINAQCLTEANYCALFRIMFTEDMKRLQEMGWPKEVGPPTYQQPHAFRLWRSETGDQAPLKRLTLSKGTRHAG